MLSTKCYAQGLRSAKPVPADKMLVLFHQIDRLNYFDNLMEFMENLETLFDRDVDLVEIQATRNPIFIKVVEREKKLIYERKRA